MKHSVNDAEFNQWFGDSRVVDSKGDPLRVFHGTTETRIDRFNIPAFFTDSRVGAEYFLFDEPDGIVIKAFLSFQNPFYACHSREESMAFIDLARHAGIKVEVDEDEYGFSFEAPMIEEYSQHDGTNINNLVYIPAMREQLIKEGYDSVITSDVLENAEIETYIALFPEQIRVIDP